MRKRLLAYVILPMMIVLLLSGCRYFWGGNYPVLTFEKVSLQKEFDKENLTYNYAISGTALNHGAPGEFKIKIYVFTSKWELVVNYPPIYINDKADFEVTWSLNEAMRVKADFYTIRMDRQSQKAHSVEF